MIVGRITVVGAESLGDEPLAEGLRERVGVGPAELDRVPAGSGARASPGPSAAAAPRRAARRRFRGACRRPSPRPSRTRPAAAPRSTRARAPRASRGRWRGAPRGRGPRARGARRRPRAPAPSGGPPRRRSRRGRASGSEPLSRSRSQQPGRAEGIEGEGIVERLLEGDRGGAVDHGVDPGQRLGRLIVEAVDLEVASQRPDPARVELGADLLRGQVVEALVREDALEPIGRGRAARRPQQDDDLLDVGGAAQERRQDRLADEARGPGQQQLSPGESISHPLGGGGRGGALPAHRADSRTRWAGQSASSAAQPLAGDPVGAGRWRSGGMPGAAGALLRPEPPGRRPDPRGDRGEQQRHRVDRGVVVADLEVEVGAGRVAGRADVPDPGPADRPARPTDVAIEERWPYQVV